MEKRKTSIFEFKLPGEFPLWPEWFKRPAGICLSCGNKINDKRKRYCSKDCKYDCYCAVQDLSVTSIRRAVHQYFKFECQSCHVHFSFFTKAGFEFPIYSGVVHHVIPLCKGGRDEFDNLMLLCKECHKEVHK